MKRLAILSTLCSAIPLWASSPFAYIANNGDIDTTRGTISVVNWQMGEPVTTITVQGRPFAVAANPNEKFVYALSEDDNAGHSYLFVIDTATNKVVATKTLSGTGAEGASSVAVTPDGNYLWITKHDGTVQIVCARTYIFLKNMTVGANADALSVVFSPDGKSAYVLAQDVENNGFVALFSTVTEKMVGQISSGVAPASFGITPDGKSLYVSFYEGTVSVVSTVLKRVMDEIPVPYAPSLAITPNGRYVWVPTEAPDYSSSQVNIVDTDTNNVVRTIQKSAAWAPMTLGFTPDGLYAYESDGSNSLMVLSTENNKVVKRIAVGEEPMAVAFLH